MSGRDGIAQSITVSAIGAVMTHPTIDLEDESISEHEVDPPDTGDLDLGSEPQSESMQAEPQERLEPALRVGPREIHQPSSRLGDAVS